jgi:hypothetical protein
MGTSVIAKFAKSACVAAVIFGAMASDTSVGVAEGRPQGGPRDWSHSRLIAARGGRDGGANIQRNWRTYVKHAALDRAREARTDPYRDWLDRFLNRRPEPATQDSHLDWNLRTGGFGNVVGSPAKYSFDITAYNCSDVIYFTVDQAGSASAVNVIAITNAYAGCSGNSTGATPTVKFGIRLTNGTATSPVLSLDGKILYVLESRPSASGGPILHAIQVNNITTTPGTYNFSTTNWTSTHTLATSPIGTATSEQLFQITFAGVTNNVASPYIDYENNQLFFGDSSGRIQRVTNIHLSTAAKDITNFPVSCGASQLQSPVFWNNQIITTSADGKLYRIDMSSGTPSSCIASAQAGMGTAGGAGGGLSAPIVDVTNDKIIICSNNAADGSGRGCGVFDLMFGSGVGPTSYTLVGVTSTTIAPVPPAFDNDFWTTNNGNLFASGTNTGGSNTYLIRLGYNGEVGAIAGRAELHHTSSNAVVATSPITEFLTGASTNPDYIFIGGNGTNYRYMNRISDGFTGTNNSPSAMTSSFAPAQGVSSGIIIDTNLANMTGSTATANIYFGTAGVASTTQSTIVQLAQAF